VRIAVEGHTIREVTALDPPGRTPLEQWPWIAPGFVDIQVNGYLGQEFSAPDLTAEKAAEIIRHMDAFGMARLCPTLTTESFETLARCLRAVVEACESDPDVDRRVAGIHLEGPYLSTDDGPRGAHPLKHCRRPDWDEFQRLQEAAGGRICIHTLSPEFDEAPQFIRRVADSGVVAALGHTSATADQIRAAADAGARLSTHLGNGAHPVLRRHPNYLWAQLAEDRLWASLIVDGHHLPPEVVKTFLRAKGIEQCVLVSDMSGMAGLPPGRYDGNICDVEILSDGRLVIAGQRELLAGASLPITVGIATVMDFTDASLEEAVHMATVQPAELLGLPSASLEPGAAADLAVFDLPESARAEPQGTGSPRLQIRSTYLAGKLVYGQPWSPAV
jgi:N-acetylglucosamine-6-phosphate deacetylase